MQPANRYNLEITAGGLGRLLDPISPEASESTRAKPDSTITSKTTWGCCHLDARPTIVAKEGLLIFTAASKASAAADFLHAFSGGREAREGIGRWMTFYNHRRPHAAHGGATPVCVYRDRLPVSGPGLRPDLQPAALVA